jgi:hypothetical protein
VKLFRKANRTRPVSTNLQMAQFLTPDYKRNRRIGPNATTAGRRFWAKVDQFLKIVDHTIPPTFDKDTVQRIMDRQRYYEARQANQNANFARDNAEHADDDNNNNSDSDEGVAVDEDDDSVDHSNTDVVSAAEDGNGAFNDSVADDSVSEDVDGLVAEDLNGNEDDHLVTEDAKGQENDSVAEDNNSFDVDDSIITVHFTSDDCAVILSSAQLKEDFQEHNKWNLREEVELRPSPSWIGTDRLPRAFDIRNGTNLMDAKALVGKVNLYNIGFFLEDFLHEDEAQGALEDEAEEALKDDE